jgi:hypothetical protein
VIIVPIIVVGWIALLAVVLAVIHVATDTPTPQLTAHPFPVRLSEDLAPSAHARRAA